MLCMPLAPCPPAFNAETPGTSEFRHRITTATVCVCTYIPLWFHVSLTPKYLMRKGAKVRWQMLAIIITRKIKCIPHYTVKLSSSKALKRNKYKIRVSTKTVVLASWNQKPLSNFSEKHFTVSLQAIKLYSKVKWDKRSPKYNFNNSISVRLNNFGAHQLFKADQTVPRGLLSECNYDDFIRKRLSIL